MLWAGSAYGLTMRRCSQRHGPDRLRIWARADDCSQRLGLELEVLWAHAIDVGSDLGLNLKYGGAEDDWPDHWSTLGARDDVHSYGRVAWRRALGPRGEWTTAARTTAALALTFGSKNPGVGRLGLGLDNGGDRPRTALAETCGPGALDGWARREARRGHWQNGWLLLGSLTGGSARRGLGSRGANLGAALLVAFLDAERKLGHWRSCARRSWTRAQAWARRSCARHSWARSWSGRPTWRPRAPSRSLAFAAVASDAQESRLWTLGSGAGGIFANPAGAAAAPPPRGRGNTLRLAGRYFWVKKRLSLNEIIA